MTESPAPAWRPTLKRRLLVTAAVLGIWTLAVEVRLVYATGGEAPEIEDELERYRHEVHVETGRAPEVD